MDRAAAPAIPPGIRLTGRRGRNRAGLAGSIAVAAVVSACTGTTQPAPLAKSPSQLATPTATPTVALAPDRWSWRIGHQHGPTIEGYADTTSVAAGTPVTLFVSTRASRFRVSAFRMGWYDGHLGLLTTRSGWLAGRQQARPVVTPRTFTVQARWAPSARLATSGWAPGHYLLRLDADHGRSSYVPLTVRGPGARGAVVLVSPVTTWQAYNRWGCCDLYAGADGNFASRSRVVSFNRPYAAENGAAEFITRELPVIAAAERLRLRLDYLTSIDLATDPNAVRGAAAVVSMGHDEYWSPTMRARVTAARSAGTNLAFFGANAMFRRIRLADHGRLEIDYKIAQEDPLYGVDDAAVTSDWPAPPDPQPESKVVGASYSCFSRTRSDGVVVDAGSRLFAGLGVVRGLRLPGLIGPETDHVVLGAAQPRPADILMHSPFPCPGGTRVPADAVVTSYPGGAAVFDAGTMSWVCALGRTCAVPATSRVVAGVTGNVLRDFAQGPAGARDGGRDNVDRVLHAAPAS